MVEIDRQWENLERVRLAGVKKTDADPDLGRAQESLLLVESFRELQRQDEASSRGDDFMAQLNEAERAATVLVDVLQSDCGQLHVKGLRSCPLLDPASY